MLVFCLSLNGECETYVRRLPLHKKLSFPQRISSVNVTKSAVADLVKFTEEILNEKFHFLCGAYSAGFIIEFEQVF